MIEKAPEKITDRVSNAFAIYAVMTTAAELLLREAEKQMATEKVAFKNGVLSEDAAGYANRLVKRLYGIDLTRKED